MSKSKRLIESIVSKLKSTLLNEEELEPTGDVEPSSDDPTKMASNAKASANLYGDRLDNTTKMKANNIVKNTLLKGYTGAVDATFIDDLDTRFDSGKRVSLDTPKTLSYDYIIQNLIYLYHTPEGQLVDIGGQSFPMTSNMKKNVYEGLLKMFDLQDSMRRWRFFIFGSNIPGVSLVPSVYRPKMSLKPDGTYDFDEVDKYVEYLNFWLKSGQLIHILNKSATSHKGFAYILTALRNKYIDLKRYESSPKRQRADYDAYTDPEYKGLDLTDPHSMGAKKDLGGRIDTTMDLRNLGGKDRGEDPAHHTLQRFVNAIKVDLAGNDPSGVDESEYESMAKHIGSSLLKFVETTYRGTKKEYVIDLFTAKLNRNPASLNDITNPEYAKLYPTANAAFAGKPRNYPQVYFRDAYTKTIKPEADRLEKEYIDQMGLEMRPQGASPDWKEKGDAGDVEKLQYTDYADPHSMHKRVNAITGQPEKFVDYGDYWNSLEENEGISNVLNNVQSAVDNFFLTD